MWLYHEKTVPSQLSRIFLVLHLENQTMWLILSDFSISITCKDSYRKQKINKEMQALNDTLDQLDLTDIYRTFHPKTMNFTFFLKRTWNILQDRSHPGP